MVALAGGCWRRENSPCPGLRPGGLGWLFRLPLEKGAAAALILAAEFLVLLAPLLDLPIQVADQLDQILSTEGVKIQHRTLCSDSVLRSTPYKAACTLKASDAANQLHEFTGAGQDPTAT